MSAIAGFNGNVYISTNASSVALTYPDVLTDSGDHTTYSEATSSKRYWDSAFAPTVQVDTVGDGAHYATVAASTYTVRYVGGKIIFNSANTAISLVRISAVGKYFAYTTFAQGTKWELLAQAMMLDVTVLGGGRAKQFIPGLTEATFNLDAFWIDNTFINNIQTAFLLIFSGTTNGTNRYEAYAYTKSDKLTDAVAKTVDEQLSFQVTGAWYYN